MLEPLPRARRAPARNTTVRAGVSTPAVVALIVCFAWTLGCAGRNHDPADDGMQDPQRRAARISELRTSIERDRSTLQELVMRPRQVGDPAIYEEPELRAIAARMNDQVLTLERLEAVQSEVSRTP